MKPLLELEAERPDMEPVGEFDALVDGELVRVTAVMERTVAYQPADGGWTARELAGKARVLVDPSLLTWRKANKGTSWRGKPVKKAS